MLILVVIKVDDHRVATANLVAPVVVNLAARRALQAVQPDSGSSAQHPLPTRGGEGR